MPLDIFSFLGPRPPSNQHHVGFWWRLFVPSMSPIDVLTHGPLPMHLLLPPGTAVWALHSANGAGRPLLASNHHRSSQTADWAHVIGIRATPPHPNTTTPAVRGAGTVAADWRGMPACAEAASQRAHLPSPWRGWDGTWGGRPLDGHCTGIWAADG